MDDVEGNACSCGEQHYCEAEVKEILGVLRSIHYQLGMAGKLAVDRVLRKYDSSYHTQRMRE